MRGYLTGSGWESYQKSGQVCGHTLPAGLTDGSKLSLSISIFTPTTKAEEGHDEHVSAESINAKYLWMEEESIWLYDAMSNYARDRGIILADTKYEWADRVLCDEWGTPDSSRFWLFDDWVAAREQGKSPVGYDKQPLRDWGKTVDTPWGLGLNNKALDPGIAEHQIFAGQVEIPENVSGDLTDRYLSLFEKLAGKQLSSFWRNEMSIKET